MFFRSLLFLTLSATPLLAQRLQPPTTLDVQENGAGSYVVSWQAMNLRPYQIETSLDLVTWLPLGDTVIGDGSEVQMLVQSDTDQLFFRHREGAVRPFVTSGSVPGLHNGSSVTLDGVISHNDDGSSHIVGGNPQNPNDHAAVALGFPINLFDETFEHLFVNNNGNITFEAGLLSFRPQPLDDLIFTFTANPVGFVDNLNLLRPVIAPQWADVSTDLARNPDEFIPIPVTYGQGTVDGRLAFFANWFDVGYFDGNINPFSNIAITRTNRLNYFQCVFIQRTDTGVEGDFDLEFNYNQIDWDAGRASNGSEGIGSGNVSGLGGRSIRVGLTDGLDRSLELANSGIPRIFLDQSSNNTGLIFNSYNSDIPGRYVFRFRGGDLEQSVTVRVLETEEVSEDDIVIPADFPENIPTFFATQFITTGEAIGRGDTEFDISWDVVQTQTGGFIIENGDTFTPRITFPFGGDFFTLELTATLIDNPSITFVDYIRVGLGPPLLDQTVTLSKNQENPEQ